MAAGSDQDEQLQPIAGPGAAADVPLVSDAESGQPQGEPRPFRLARARAVFGALLASAVLAAVVLVGPQTAARVLVERARGSGSIAVSLEATAAEMNEMLDAVNTERMKQGLPSLCYNQKLIAAAQEHSDDMDSNNFFSHSGSDGSSVSQRVARAGYSPRLAIENVAQGQTSVTNVMNSRMANPIARANILTDGISHFGWAKSSRSWTQVFASPHGQEGCVLAGGGADGHGGTCRDFVPPGESFWHDSDGGEYHCNWYAASEAIHGVGTNCETHGHSFEKYGHTASTACCACGGGGGCEDIVPHGFVEWFDSDGAQYHCDYYGEGHNCNMHGNEFENGGHTASEACCVCGGGSTGSEPAPGPAPPAPAPEPSSGKGCGESCAGHGDCRTNLFC